MSQSFARYHAEIEKLRAKHEVETEAGKTSAAHFVNVVKNSGECYVNDLGPSYTYDVYLSDGQRVLVGAKPAHRDLNGRVMGPATKGVASYAPESGWLLQSVQEVACTVKVGSHIVGSLNFPALPPS